MNEQNKKNALFLGKVALIALVAFFTIVMVTYLAEARGLWSAPLPVLAIAYGIYSFITKYLAKDEGKKETKE